jgi:hypothetical protein
MVTYSCLRIREVDINVKEELFKVPIEERLEICNKLWVIPACRSNLKLAWCQLALAPP